MICSSNIKESLLFNLSFEEINLFISNDSLESQSEEQVQLFYFNTITQISPDYKICILFT